MAFENLYGAIALLRRRVNSLSGNASRKRRAVLNVATTLLATDHMIAYSTLTATRAITLPAASTVTDKHFVIKDEAGTATANPITVVGTINGAVNPTVVSTNYGTYRFYSNGVAYFSE